jgi:hypothetical protein
VKTRRPSWPAITTTPTGDAADVVIERNWRFAGVGFLDLDTAARALASAALAREHR